MAEKPECLWLSLFSPAGGCQPLGVLLAVGGRILDKSFLPVPSGQIQGAGGWK